MRIDIPARNQRPMSLRGGVKFPKRCHNHTMSDEFGAEVRSLWSWIIQRLIGSIFRLRDLWLHIKIVAMNFVYNLLACTAALARSLWSSLPRAHLHNTIFECEWEFVHAAPAALAWIYDLFHPFVQSHFHNPLIKKFISRAHILSSLYKCAGVFFGLALSAAACTGIMI